VCHQLPTLVHTEYEAGKRCVIGFILVVDTGFEAVHSFILWYTIFMRLLSGVLSASFCPWMVP
jgi:hypothetical protein